MKRKCTIIKSSADKKRHICVDDENSDEIYSYISKDERHRKKFNYIATLILEGIRSKEHYCKEDINEDCEDVTAMRFFVGQENDRLYCKEFTNAKGIFIVVAAELFLHKDTRKLKQAQINIINKVGKYEYEDPIKE